MFSLQIVQSPNFLTHQNTLDDISKIVSENILPQQNWTINIVFLDENGIQNLNKKYRDKDEATDVLSFHYFEDFSELSPGDVAGEIVLCESKVVSQGDEYWLGTEKEFYKLVIHSLLHILWYDHETDEDYEEMKKWEEVIWREIFWS